MSDPRNRLRLRLELARRGACEAGDHARELEVAGRLLADADPEAEREMLWGHVGWLVGIEHVAESAVPGARLAIAERWHAKALSAYDELDHLLRAHDVRPNTRRRTLDVVVTSLRRAEESLGLPASPQVSDLARREQARAVPRGSSKAFFAKHAGAVVSIWAHDAKPWWHGRFLERHGVEPPADWWIDNPEMAMGGHVNPRCYQEGWFDRADQEEFLAEMERHYRDEMSLPARGEGWVSELHLARCVEAALPGVEIVRQARPSWLGAGQSLDLFIPSLSLALEYQGEQHYLPLAHLGGEQGLTDRRELDERKRDACARARVRLVEWRYDEPVSEEAVRERLRRLVAIPDRPGWAGWRSVP